MYRQPEQPKTVSDVRFGGSPTPDPLLNPPHQSPDSPGPVSSDAVAAAGAVAGVAAAVGNTFGVEDSPVTTYIDDLPDSARIAHRVLAALGVQFSKHGWSHTPLAVAVFRKSGRVSVVFATGDAVSLWPYGVQLPAGVVPLSRVDGIPADFLRSWNGVDDPVGKLVEFSEDYPELLGGVEAIAVSSPDGAPKADDLDGLVTTQTVDQRAELVSTAVVPAVSVTRGSMSRVAPGEVVSALMKADLVSGDSEHPDNWVTESRLRAAQLRAAARADRGGDVGYAAVLASFLLAEAHACVDEGRESDAGFSVGELLSLEPTSV